MRARAEAAMGQIEHAAGVIAEALARQPSAGVRARLLMELSALQRAGRDYAGAIVSLDMVDQAVLSADQQLEHLKATAATYRQMGLFERAGALLKERLKTLNDSEDRVPIATEMARCLAADGDTTAARDLLTDTLTQARPGAAASEAALELSGLCLADDRPEQALAVAGRLLKDDDPAVRRRALEIIGRAYARNEDYRRAVLAFAGMIGKKERTEP
jgi:tetratricopeptide (TPR) repeat protein